MFSFAEVDFFNDEIKSKHSLFPHLNAGEHGEAPGADQSKAERDDEPNDEPDGHQLPALPHRPELAALHLKHLPQVKQ